MKVDDVAVARGLAASRLAVGLVATVAPGLALKPWLGPDAAGAGTRTLGRMFGARDAVLGAGALWALQDGSSRDASRWIRLSAACDAVDATGSALLAGRLRNPLTYAVAATGVAACVAGFRTAARL